MARTTVWVKFPTLVVVSSRSLTGVQPAEFEEALRQLAAARLRSEITLSEVPAPSRIAPWSVAFTAEVASGDDDELANGRFVLLHDPSVPESWGGAWRCVTYARAEMEPELASDPMLGTVGWSWLEESLARHEVDHVAEAGTVTRVVSESYGALADRPPSIDLEIRASWTAPGPQVRAHLEAWADLLCTIGGLPPLPEGVVALPARRR